MVHIIFFFFSSRRRHTRLQGGWISDVCSSDLPVFAGLAEFERELIKERTGTGRIAAKERGVRFGRPSSLSPDQTVLARRLLDEGKSAREVAETFGVHKTTIYRATASKE